MSIATRTQPIALVAIPRRGPFADRLVREATLLLGAVALLSLLSQVAIEVPFSSNRTGELVPITGQTFGVLLIGITLGMRRGVSSVLTYLAIGLLGAPVFSQGGAGAGVLFTGSTAGYLWGFLLAAGFTGWCADRGLDRGPWLYAVLLVGSVLVYAAGLPILALWLDRHEIPLSVWTAGLWPFIPGDLVKLMAAAILVPAAWGAVNRFRS